MVTWPLNPLFNQLGHAYKYRTDFLRLVITKMALSGEINFSSNGRVIAGGGRGSPAKLYFITLNKIDERPVSLILADFCKSAMIHFLKCI
jgi:hypothetical protein